MGFPVKKLLLAFAAATLIAFPPAQATTFANPTIIYVGSGVFDSGDGPNTGTATSVHCSNFTGTTASVTVLFFSAPTVFRGKSGTTFANAKTVTVSTHGVLHFNDLVANTGAISKGFFIVQSTQSGVYCTAMIVDADGPPSSGIALHMVRYNPHPETVE